MIPVPVAALLAAALTIAGLAPAQRTAVTVQVADPPPTAAPWPDMPGPCAEWAPVAFAAGWPVDQWPTISRVMWCESKCQPKAYNRSGASGLMQVLRSWFGPDEDPFDPATNLTVARRVHQRQGWRAWSCY